MSDNALVVLPNQVSIQQGGLGIDLNNPIFNLDPSTLNITKEGRLKISDTGEEFDEMLVALLDMPKESRAYHIGEADEMNRTAENLMCYSTDMIEPSPKSKVPQSLKCANCPRADWKPYREAKDKGVTGKALKALIPPCQPVYKVVLMDTIFKLPLKMYIRSTRRDPFEAGMEKIGRQILMMQAQGRNPNIFDVRFKLSTKLEQRGQYKYYVPIISDVKAVTPEEREAFGAVYIKYVAYKEAQSKANATAQEQAETDAANESIDAELTENATPLEGEYLSQPDGTITV